SKICNHSSLLGAWVTQTIPVSKPCSSLGLEISSIEEKLRCQSVQPEISSCIRLSNLYTAYILPLFAILCDLDMLEELQRLQGHIGALKTRLAQLESENSSLREEQDSTVSQHQAEINQKNSSISQKQQENDRLTEQ